MIFFKRFFIFLIFLCIGISSSMAVLIPPTPFGRVIIEDIPEKHAKVKLISKINAIDGQKKIILGIHFELSNDAYISWRTAGDSGQAPNFDWSGSENIENIKLLWPVPKRFSLEELTNFGYEKEVVFPVEITLKNPNAPLSARLFTDYIVCQGSCYPEQSTLSLDLYNKKSSPTIFSKLIERFEEKIPNAPNNTFFVDNITADNQNIYVLAKSNVFFWEPNIFIESKKPSIVFDSPQIETNGKNALFTIPYEKIKEAGVEDFNVWDQSFTLTITDNEKAIETQRNASFGKISSLKESNIKDLDKSSIKLYLLMIFTALIGGFILNFMPCVLPVIAIKTLHLIKDKEKANNIFRINLLATASGIIVTFFTLATIAVTIKSAGGVLGWGMQFQSQNFLIFMIVILILFSLNIFGLYQIPVPAKLADKIDNFNKQCGFEGASVVSNFFSGVLATILATPCTAPFLGTALGFALSRTALDIYMIFILLGIGLAMPYIILSIFPNAIKMLPKTGKWMIYLKNILGVLLIFTAIWLSSILMLGREKTIETSMQWETFNESRIEKLVSKGHTVFVNITADWCITCKYNERFILNNSQISALFNSYNIIPMQADWTRKNPEIKKYLGKFNHYGVPFNAVYSPAQKNPLILSELLTKKSVTKAIMSDIIN